MPRWRLAPALFRREALEQDMDAEMRTHIDLEAEELESRGLPAAEARRQAHLAFGGVQQRKEEALEQRSIQWIENLRRDVRIAVRTLLRHPTFAITATLALSLAIAVNTSMFSVIDAMMNPRVAVRDPDRLMLIRYWGPPDRKVDFTWRDRVLGDSGRTYESVTGARWYQGGVVERGDALVQTSGTYVRPNYFATLGVSPLEGTLAPSTDPATAAATIVISDRLRAQLFRASESPVGHSVDVDGIPYRVIGVVSRFSGLLSPDNGIWLFPPPGLTLGAGLIRLRPGATTEDVLKETNILSARLALAEGADMKESRFAVEPMKRQFQVQRFHWALIGAGLAVLLVACTNLANLQLARGLGRASELALRSAVGASRRQIISTLMIEGAVLATGAAALAVLFALAGNAVIHATIPPNIGGYIVEPQASWRMVAFAAVAALVSLLIVGLAPAIRVSVVDLNSLLKSRAGTGTHKNNRRVYGTLVITQIALTLPLVCAAALLASAARRPASSGYLMHELYGFDTRPIVVGTFMVPPTSDSSRTLMEITESVLSRVRGLEGVGDAAVSVKQGVATGALTVDDVDGSTRELQSPNFEYQIVSPAFFRTMGLPIERGKDFPDGGNDQGLVIMDRGSAWYLWPRSSPSNRLIKLGGRATNEPWLRVQGIVGDYLSEDARALKRVADTLRVNSIYRVMTVHDTLMSNKNATFVHVFARATSDPQRVASRVRRALGGQGSGIRPPSVGLFEEYQGIPQRAAVLRFIAGLFTTFGVIALGLSALGVYGIVAQSVTDRQREVAVRISLGATPANIVRVLIREGNVLVLAGVAIGLYVSKETMGWLGSFLGDADLQNALMFGALCVVVFTAMVVSAFVPAMRATRMDPMEVLRAE
ncbi:MAG: ABC transporter permease [Gemmatimonadaceae bacterium]